MAQNAKVSYDKDYDIFYANVGEKVKESVEIDDFVVDLSADNRIVGVEIFGASTIMSKLSLVEINRGALEGVKSATLSTYQSKELIYIVIGLSVMIGGRLKEVSIQLPAPKMEMPAG